MDRGKIKNEYFKKLKEIYFSNEKNIELNTPSLVRDLNKTVRFKSINK